MAWSATADELAAGDRGASDSEGATALVVATTVGGSTLPWAASFSVPILDSVGLPGCQNSTEATTTTLAAKAAHRRFGHANHLGDWLAGFRTGISSIAASGFAVSTNGGRLSETISRQSPQLAKCRITPSRSTPNRAC